MMFFRANMQAAGTEQLPFTLIEQLNNLIKLIEDWFQQLMGLGYQTRMGGDHDEGNNNGQPSKILCGICFDFKPALDMFVGGKCKHPFCKDCISNYVAAKIQQQNIFKVKCPDPNCSVELKPQNLHNTLPKEVIVRWESARCESSIVGWQKTYCPFNNCSVLLVNDGGEVVTHAECPSCHRLFCAQCKVPWHAGMNCKEFPKKLRRSKDLDKKFLELAREKGWPKCPNCTMYVQKRSGCEHMKCRSGCNFCYNCAENWEFGHTCNRRRSK